MAKQSFTLEQIEESLKKALQESTLKSEIEKTQTIQNDNAIEIFFNNKRKNILFYISQERIWLDAKLEFLTDIVLSDIGYKLLPFLHNPLPNATTGQSYLIKEPTDNLVHLRCLLTDNCASQSNELKNIFDIFARILDKISSDDAPKDASSKDNKDSIAKKLMMYGR